MEEKQNGLRSRGPKKSSGALKHINLEEIDDKKSSRSLLSLGADTKLHWIVVGVITILAIATRFYRIDHPHAVVFDEVHFGKFASYYIKRSFFFDVHPPLAKMMLAFAGWIVGYDGHFEFTNIGDDYIENDVPYIAMRTLPAILGALTVSLTYLIMKESGYPVITCAFAAMFMLFDNAHVAQTRLILLDSMLVFFMACALLCYVKFYKLRHREFSQEWWAWLILSGFFLSMTISVKMVGLFTILTVGCAVLVDLWNLLDYKRGLTIDEFGRHFIARAIGLILVPLTVYLFWFWVHFQILNTSGPGDVFMSPKFQETLKGNIMTMESTEIHYYDKVTIQHKDTKVYLHSHIDRYPLRYEDGRISSQGQQVTGYPFNDTNNQWIIKPADPFPDITKRLVKNRAIVKLEHANTKSDLLTHDVASPLMPTNQEFTTMPVNDLSRHNETLFRIEIFDGNDDTTFKTKASHFKLIHVNTNVAMWTYKSILPDWAFKQQEVNGNKNQLDKTNLWFVENIIKPNKTDLPTGAEKIGEAETGVADAEEEEEAGHVKAKPLRKIPFLVKFVELQGHMIRHNAGLTSSHPYATTPINWPFLLRGISFWTKDEGRMQIYLLGNPLGWWILIGLVAVYMGVFLADQLSRRRGVYPLPDSLRDRLYNSTGFFFVAWAFHYAPFYLMGRQLFLHHYLPSHLASALLGASIFQFLFVKGVNHPVSEAGPKTRPRPFVQVRVPIIAYVFAGVVTAGLAATFVFFSPLTYGTPGLDVAGVLSRKWLSTWDLHFAK